MISAQDLKAAVNSVEIIGGYVRLRKVGRRHVGLCPFHSEKTPSFSVNECGLWHCFGCGAGGDIFTFLELQEGLDFRGAFRRLAAIAGVPVDRQDTYEEPPLALKLSGPECRAFDRWRWLKLSRLEGLWRFCDQQQDAFMAYLEGCWNETPDAQAVEAVHGSLNRLHETKALIDEQVVKLETDPSFMIEPFLRSLYGDQDFRAEVQGL